MKEWQLQALAIWAVVTFLGCGYIWSLHMRLDNQVATDELVTAQRRLISAQRETIQQSGEVLLIVLEECAEAQ